MTLDYTPCCRDTGQDTDVRHAELYYMRGSANIATRNNYDYIEGMITTMNICMDNV